MTKSSKFDFIKAADEVIESLENQIKQEYMRERAERFSIRETRHKKNIKKQQPMFKKIRKEIREKISNDKKNRSRKPN